MKGKLFILLASVVLMGAIERNPYAHSLYQKTVVDDVKLEIHVNEIQAIRGMENTPSGAGRVLFLNVVVINNKKEDVVIDYNKFRIVSSAGEIKPFGMDVGKKGVDGVATVGKGKMAFASVYFFARYDIDVSAVKIGQFGTFEFQNP